MIGADTLTPTQRETLALLGRRGDPVVFDAAFVAELRDDFETGLGELAERVGEPSGDRAELVVTKRSIDSVLACEAAWAAPDDFAWSPATARGTIAHRAIQLSVHWPAEPVPATLVEEAIARVIDEERGIGEWLADCDPADHADLRSRTVEHVTKFLECFPPLDRTWRPVTEARASFPPSGPIALRAQVDLMIGPPRGNESTKVIVDVKTGRPHPRHRHDLRFYALVETLTRRLPPRLLATYSLDSGTAETEVVTEALLRSTLRRTLDAIDRMVEVRFEDREPSRSPGVACRWCPLRAECAEGRAHLAAVDDPDGDEP
ncbi:PD-(D/E)XK nuclease family protein [Desertimonas flava]|uniref:PD-(D/E)XK nuclease family protein n=1 Tax=Desertimonas flava TaxID=2064846 RepID=UPI000E34643E|nr:PD-(D/E)XK nuclease family protein [Desertimonas flava]